MKKQDKKERIIKGDDAKYMMQAMDRQNIPYQKKNGNVVLLMTDEEYSEALEDMQCEKEMEAINYRFCIVSLRTACAVSDKCDRIMSSMNTNGFLVMQKDQKAYENMLKYDV
jgi:hypothetical protein